MARQFISACTGAADIRSACGHMFVYVCMYVCTKSAQQIRIIVKGKADYHNRKGIFYCREKNCHVFSTKNMHNMSEVQV